MTATARPDGRARPAGRIRPAEPADVEALLALEEAAFPGDRLERRHFRHAIRSPTVLSLVAEGQDGAVLGYVLAETRRGARVARLSSLAVAPGRDGSGLGRLLVEAAEAEARSRGCHRIRLEVRADNARAASLYGRAGYRETGREPDYYEDGEAAVKLEKTLREPA